MEPIYKEYQPPLLTGEEQAAFLADMEKLHAWIQQKDKQRQAVPHVIHQEKIDNLQQIYTILCQIADQFGGYVRLVVNPVESLSYVLYDGGVFTYARANPRTVSLASLFCLADAVFLYGQENSLFRFIFLSDVFQDGCPPAS